MKRTTSRIALVTVAAFLAGCGGGASSPEAAFDTFADAAKSKDYQAMIESVTPETQEMMLGSMVFGASFQAMADESKQASLDELFKKYGIDTQSDAMGEVDDPEKAMKQLVAGVKDRPACFAAIMEWIEENTEGERPDMFEGADFDEAELTEVKIDGDKATGTVVTDGNEDSNPMQFQRIDGVWYIDLMASNGGPGRF
jgi:hypothetical protein